MTTGRALVLLILLGALVINSIYLGYLIGTETNEKRNKP